MLWPAAEALAHPGEEPILLPAALGREEDQLNPVREKALRDAMAAKEAEQRKNDLIVYLTHDLKTSLADWGLTCALDLPSALEYICDPDKLARVFDNLLRNACHYSTAGTEVTIAAAVEEKDIVLTVTNTDATIPEEKLGRIFEQFFRLDSSRATRAGGTGSAWPSPGRLWSSTAGPSPHGARMA